MTQIAQSIDLKLSEKLKDRDYRRKFFLADCSARIAAQIIALRKRRGLDQQQVADLIGARQTAISRVESADYQNWNFNTLREIADALDARIRVLIEPSEDILRQYDGANDAEEPEIIEFENAEAIDTNDP
jgi:transcriptional regulator with XRE-family HTH domain